MDGILTEFMAYGSPRIHPWRPPGVAHYLGKLSKAYQLLGLVRLEVEAI
jgi:hypothetical protein